MRKLASILFVVFMLGVTLPAFASPFSDLPADHWATQAVQVLAEKGLVEGYPDGTFKGDRAATRYEVAMIVARLVAYLEKQKPQVTKEDLDAIRQLVDEYKDELDAMGVRLKNVEDTLADLEGRVKRLEAIRVSGAFETRFYSGEVKTTDASATPTPFQFDALAEGSRLPLDDQNAVWNHVMTHNWDNDNDSNDVEGYPMDRIYNVVPTESGTSESEVGYLKVSAKLDDNYTASGVVGLYNNQGDLGNGFTYGVTAPTLDNPTYNANAPYGGYDPILENLNASLAQVSVTNDVEHLNVVVGEWEPAYIPDQLLKGVPNPGVYGPDYLPFYGGQLFGQLSGNSLGSGMFYELAAGKLPSALDVAAVSPTGAAEEYQNEVFGGALGYKWDDPGVKITGGLVRVLNDSASLPAGTSGAAVAGGGTLGYTPGLWCENAAGACTAPLGSTATDVGIGPQQETLYGLDASISPGHDWKWLTVWGKYGNSQYNGNHSSDLYDTVGGNMYSAGIEINKWHENDPGKLSGGADYLDVEPTYDPFVAQINIASTAFTGPVDFYSFPFPVSYGPLLTSFEGDDFLTNGTATNPAGDIYYNVHDARQYPDNRSGYKAHLNWNYGHGNVGGSYEDYWQSDISTPGNEFQPGFYEPIFFTVPGLASSSDPGKGTIKTWDVHADYTVPSNELTLSGIFVQNQIQRPTLDDNNIDLQLSWWKVGLTYRPAGNNVWAIQAGVDEFYSNGAGQYLEAPDLPGFFLFREDGAYFGVNYQFSHNAEAWIQYNVFAQHDESNGESVGTFGTPASNFNGTSLSSGLRFLF